MFPFDACERGYNPAYSYSYMALSHKAAILELEDIYAAQDPQFQIWSFVSCVHKVTLLQ